MRSLIKIQSFIFWKIDNGPIKVVVVRNGIYQQDHLEEVIQVILILTILIIEEVLDPFTNELGDVRVIVMMIDRPRLKEQSDAHVDIDLDLIIGLVNLIIGLVDLVRLRFFVT